MKRFKGVYLLHGKGGSPNGTVRLLKHAIIPHIAGIIFMRPHLAHHDPQVSAEESMEQLLRCDIPSDLLLIGISVGGLVAASFQEERQPDLHVICISSPTWADGVRLERRDLPRVALYSSSDPVIAGRTALWPLLAPEAYDLRWLTHDTDQHLGRLAPALAAYVNGEDYQTLLENPEHENHS